MSKTILAAVIAIASLVGPTALDADAKNWKHGCYRRVGNGCGYPGNSYWGRNHPRGYERGCGGPGWNFSRNRGTIVDRLVGNGYGGGYRRGWF
jgi:hypothetical protein